MNNMNRWNIKHPIYGESVIIPNTIRYWKNQRHPYGWEVSFTATLVLKDGNKIKSHFSALGVDQRTAKANAISR